MKKILLLLALGLTASLASSEMNTENEQQVKTKEVVTQEIRNARTAPSNRVARVSRKIREERLLTISLRDTRTIRYVNTQINTHLSSLQ